MNKSLFYIALVFLLTLGCTKEVDIELNNEENSRLVVEGLITTEQTAHKVRLTRTSSYFSNQSPPVETGATVSVSDGTTTFLLSETEPGLYVTDSNVAGEIGKTYTLNISTTDGEKYTASCELKQIAHLDSITDRKSTRLNSSHYS